MDNGTPDTNDLKRAERERCAWEKWGAVTSENPRNTSGECPRNLRPPKFFISHETFASFFYIQYSATWKLGSVCYFPEYFTEFWASITKFCQNFGPRSLCISLRENILVNLTVKKEMLFNRTCNRVFQHNTNLRVRSKILGYTSLSVMVMRVSPYGTFR